MRALHALLLAAALSTSSARAADRTEEWTQDLQALGTQLGSIHARYRQCEIPPSLRGDLENLAARVDSLADSEVTVEIQRILASVGDGHTLLFPFGMKRGTLRRLPVMLWQFDDGMFIVQSKTPALVGRQVIAIGDLAIAEVGERLQKYISHDNDQQLRWAGPFYATLTDFLAAIGAGTRDEQSVTLDHGELVTLKSEDIDPATIDLKLPPSGNGAPPAYLSRRSSPFWQKKLDEQTLYVQLNAVDDDQDETLNDFGRRLRPLLANVTRLILDLRLNSGGEARKANEFLKTLISFDTAGGRIAVLTSRMTFSAAQTLATRLDEFTDAIFVGEATGSRPNHYGNERPFKLPNSGLRGTIASGFNQPISANDDRVTIQPDAPVGTTSADYFAGRDPVLDAALKRLNVTSRAALRPRREASLPRLRSAW
jgi:hypothetical protein